MSQNNQQDPWSKIFIFERDLLENQKYLNKLDEKYSDLLNKLDTLKDDIRSQKNVADFEERICDLEEMVDSLRQEMPEMRLIRKLFFALVGFVLMSFLGLIWNNVVLTIKGRKVKFLKCDCKTAKHITDEHVVEYYVRL